MWLLFITRIFMNNKERKPRVRTIIIINVVVIVLGFFALKASGEAGAFFFFPAVGFLLFIDLIILMLRIW